MDNVIAQKIGIFLLFVIAIITLVFRKYFYMSLSTKEDSSKQKVTSTKKTEKKKEKLAVIEAAESTKDEGLKIKIEKEIK